MDRAHLESEQRLAASMNLDAMPIAEAVALMGAAVELVAAAIGAGGRLIYVGAGTSGRLGMLDAAECPPTFRSDPSQVQGIIAGSERAMFVAQEGAEDRFDDGGAVMDERRVGPGDVVMGIAAGGTTPFVHGALRRATERGARTIFLSCVQSVPGEPAVDVVIRPITGPEVLTGSTRLKAGTATKLVLNTISTLAMVRCGKVYENLMVDLRATNSKLRDRAIRIVQQVTGASRDSAAEVLERAGGHVKLAIVMQRRSIEPEAAQRLLDAAGGELRAALDPKRSE
jgi:N-acetylmuramic acid 6-phosphate etherase